jgi:gamma-glutamyl-gamma-aminobutyrate hydrolase PuuD
MNSKDGDNFKLAHGWALLVGLCLTFTAIASTCLINRPIIIGHTYELDWITRFRLKNSAREMNYEVQFKDLRTDNWEKELTKIDALLVPGGADIHPGLFATKDLTPEMKQQIESHRKYYRPSDEGKERDPFEYQVFQTYFNDDKFKTLPALGICRGMQMMAVSQGVPLVQDLKAELGLENRNYSFDTIDVIDNESIVAKMFPEGQASGLKIHHQNPSFKFFNEVKHRDLKVTATSQGLLTEAIESLSRPAIGLQIHPEKSFPSVKHSVFKWLLSHACERVQQGEIK